MGASGDGRSGGADGTEGGGEGDAGRGRGASGTERVRVVSRETLSDAWARLERVAFDYRRGDGREERQVREIYHRGHGATVLLHDAARDTVILVRQFRLPVLETECGALGPPDPPRPDDEPGFLLETPAGVLDGEGAAARVRAEAEEETGFRIGEPRYLFAAYVSPGSVTELIHYFVAPYSDADRVGRGGGLEGEGEDIEVVELSLDEALARVADGRVRDAKTIVLLQHAALERARSGSG